METPIVLCGICGGVSAIMAGAKVVGWITLSWAIVSAPVWIPLISIAGFFAMFFIVGFFLDGI